MNIVALYTDGSCLKNKDGGWGCVLVAVEGGYRKELSGYERNSTNNRMELMAVLKGLQALKEPCTVTVHSDSMYVVNTFDKGWALKWMSNEKKLDIQL